MRACGEIRAMQVLLCAGHSAVCPSSLSGTRAGKEKMFFMMLVLKTVRIFWCGSNCGNYFVSFPSVDVFCDCSYAVAYSLQ